MPPKKRCRSSPKKDEASQELEAAHITSPSSSSSIDQQVPIATKSITTTTTTTTTRAAASVVLVASGNAEKPEQQQQQRQKLPSDLEGVVLRSAVIAPDVVGIRCVAVHPNEREMVIVRENGSMVLYTIDTFQNVPHFTQIRHTGGQANRTVTRLRYLPNTRPLLVASYLSGQLVIYCGTTLAPLYVHQRSGGAVWDFCIAGSMLFAAMGDGAWQQLQVENTNNTNNNNNNTQRPTLVLRRIIPKVSGADRALSVCCAVQYGIAAGTDDAGNVMAWRLPRDAMEENNTDNDNNSGMDGRPMGLSDHETLWTSRLPKGMALCCAISNSGKKRGPVVAVGTSMGDVVFFDAQHGHILHTFTHHKGPISTLVSSSNPNKIIKNNEIEGDVLYASGWHESLRSYRCNADGEWYPAEVKRRTHYHEASELVILQQHQLILSSSRDGTIMYAPLASVFKSPAMYVPVTTQQFAFAKSKNVLLQTRRGRIEAFRTDAALRHWTPLFAHKIHGKFHLQGMWCDAKLHYILFTTDARATLLRVCWRDGAEDALALHRIEEVLGGISIGYGVLDCCFIVHNNNNNNTTTTNNNNKKKKNKNTKKSENENEEEKDNENTAPLESCYLLLDDSIVHITLAAGYPVVSTAMQLRDDGETVSNIRPTRLLFDESNSTITVCGLRGRLTCDVAPDGTIDPNSFTLVREPTRMAASVPMLIRRNKDDDEDENNNNTNNNNKQEEEREQTIVALMGNERFMAGLGTSNPCLLPRTLPHDVQFIARLPPLCNDDNDNDINNNTSADITKKHDQFRFLAIFSRGLLYVTENAWHMVQRCTVEAAFVLRGDDRVLVLLRNIEGTLEALPMCWKVRRFGN
ncbi:putative aminopeptidase, putative,metallo-peptidase, Clan MG, Family M24 [Trypanosoma theileri]|uniref:Putative aminopeptidase, putative,metallo-peptidase, Clan MG, Family M24 n=1 Tax=Trypanosoma theileri TaxID=67003 RepID=A0A1X0NNL7_9TRYP|nr:putative aminopeptidase, putative,metallo-peptidase, Clan MG, Family M24 [Trypanosoma theileri]ORC85739.1 putative aminopeptidase, putative,metallo-peptidase, Clan MG, Family M24 [Trypanosoma theileri]